MAMHVECFEVFTSQTDGSFTFFKLFAETGVILCVFQLIPLQMHS